MLWEISVKSPGSQLCPRVLGHRVFTKCPELLCGNSEGNPSFLGPSQPVWGPHSISTGESERAERAHPGGVPEGGLVSGGRRTEAPPGPEEGGGGHLREAAGQQGLPGAPEPFPGPDPLAAGGAEPAGAAPDAAGEARGCSGIVSLGFSVLP